MAGLHHKNVRASHIFQNLKMYFAVAEAAQARLPDRYIQMLANAVRQRGVGGTRKNFEPVVVQNAIAPAVVFKRPQYFKSGLLPDWLEHCGARTYTLPLGNANALSR